MGPTTDRVLDLWIPYLPPSENRIRLHRWQRGTTYTREAKDYKKRFAAWVQEHYLLEVSAFAAKHTDRCIYSLSIHFYFDTVINKGWAKNRAKTLYKRFDVGNRRKLVEDCLVEVLGGIDDSLFFELTLTKSMGSSPGVRMLLRPATPSEFGVPDVRQNKQDGTS